MASNSAEAVLHKAAEDGSLDSADWPETLQYILDRLDEIITDFPRPTHAPSSSPAPSPSHPQSTQESTATDKENAAPSTPPSNRPPVPGFSSTPNHQTGFPQETINFYTSIRTTLTKNFSKNPPHTIQRLAELILSPKQHYRFLPPYLKALDRIVCVSSPNNIFPLPLAVLPTTPGSLLNGTATPLASTAPSLGSDESLGGALLTPIPWLQNRGAQNELISESTEIVDGPNGAGRIETVTVGMLNGNGNSTSPTSPSAQTLSPTGIAQIASSHPDGETLPSTGPVTQGEILRQEQEAGVVLNNPHSMTQSHTRPSASENANAENTVMQTVESEDEMPHARGPETIGLEDTGIVQKSNAGGLDIEGAVGRPSIERGSKSPQPPAAASEAKDEEMKDDDAKGEEVQEDEDGAGTKEEEGVDDMQTDA